MTATAIEQAYVHNVEHKYIDRPGEEKPIDLVSLRVRIDRSYRSGQKPDGSPNYNRDRDFWIDAEVWGPRGLAIRDRITKGAAVLMVGRYDNRRWEDNTGTTRDGYVFRVTRIAILPWCIQSITYWSRDDRDAGTGNTEPPVDAYAADFDESDVPF